MKEQHCKRILVTVSLVQTLAAAGLLLVHSRSSLWIGYFCLCVISAFGSFVGPAAQAGIPNLARDPDARGWSVHAESAVPRLGDSLRRRIASMHSPTSSGPR